MQNGYWEVRAALRLLAFSRRRIRRQGRFSHKARVAENSGDVSLLPIWQERKIPSREIALNSSGATEHSNAPWHWKEEVHFLEKQVRGLIHARRSKRRLSCSRARRPRLYSCLGRQKAESRLATS